MTKARDQSSKNTVAPKCNRSTSVAVVQLMKQISFFADLVCCLMLPNRCIENGSGNCRGYDKCGLACPTSFPSNRLAWPLANEPALAAWGAGPHRCGGMEPRHNDDTSENSMRRVLGDPTWKSWGQTDNCPVCALDPSAWSVSRGCADHKCVQCARQRRCDGCQRLAS